MFRATCISSSVLQSASLIDHSAENFLRADAYSCCANLRSVPCQTFLLALAASNFACSRCVTSSASIRSLLNNLGGCKSISVSP